MYRSCRIAGNSFKLRIFFFPHLTPRHRKLDFRSRLSQGWLELRLGRVNIVHDLAGVNKEWQVANLGCFLKGYTSNSGFSPPNSTTDCVEIGRASYRERV